jgi:hypothetical protein
LFSAARTLLDVTAEVVNPLWADPTVAAPSRPPVFFLISPTNSLVLAVDEVDLGVRAGRDFFHVATAFGTDRAHGRQRLGVLSG